MAYLIDFDEGTAQYIYDFVGCDKTFFAACDAVNQYIIANGNRIAGIEAKE